MSPDNHGKNILLNDVFTGGAELSTAGSESANSDLDKVSDVYYSVLTINKKKLAGPEHNCNN